MLTQVNESQGDPLQNQLESDMRELFGCEIMLETDSDDDTCSTCSSVYTVGDVSIITEEDDLDVLSVEDNEEDEEGVVTEEEGVVTEEGGVVTEEEVVTEVTDASEDMPGAQSENVTSGCPGFGVVIDNVDINVRRSHQRIGRTTQSYHFCHGYAVLNRVDSTKLLDRLPSGALSVDLILPNESDIDSILDDFIVLAARYIHTTISTKWTCCTVTVLSSVHSLLYVIKYHYHHK